MTGARQLLIFRHAKSAWDMEAGTDFERPLSQRGDKDAVKMGQWLRSQDLIPDLIVSSPALRAYQTAVWLAETLDIAEKDISFSDRIYEADLTALNKILAVCPPEAQRVLLVGHNPGLEELLEYLCTTAKHGDDGKLLMPATVAVINLPQDWEQLEPGSGEFVSITRPRQVD